MNPSGKKEYASKTKTCYNCHDKGHFFKECPYENRELHGGRLATEIIQQTSVLMQEKIKGRDGLSEENLPSSGDGGPQHLVFLVDGSACRRLLL